MKFTKLVLPLLSIQLMLVANHCSANTEKPTAVPLFNGKNLDGWKTLKPENKAKYWSVVDGVITVSNGQERMPMNSFLATDKNYTDFEFTCQFRITGDPKTGLINAGIQYRSPITQITEGPNPNWNIVGYQADIGDKYWGCIYDEHRRGMLVKGNVDALMATNFKNDAWHSYKIICKGNDHKLYIDDVLMASYTEKDDKIPDTGVIALQIHSGGILKVEYKDILIKEFK